MRILRITPTEVVLSNGVLVRYGIGYHFLELKNALEYVQSLGVENLEDYKGKFKVDIDMYTDAEARHIKAAANIYNAIYTMYDYTPSVGFTFCLIDNTPQIIEIKNTSTPLPMFLNKEDAREFYNNNSQIVYDYLKFDNYGQYIDI